MPAFFILAKIFRRRNLTAEEAYHPTLFSY